jgi:non-ribosomal peptide synthetase component F
MVANSGAVAVVVELGSEGAFSSFGGLLVTVERSGAVGSVAGEVSSTATVGEGVAYIMYTSGSTGMPKGCLGTHVGLWNRCQWMYSNYPFEEGEVCCAKTAVTFVDSVWEIFGPLLRGVPLLMLSDDVARDSAELVRCIELYRVTRVVVVPVLLAAMLDVLEDRGDRAATPLTILTAPESIRLDRSCR